MKKINYFKRLGLLSALLGTMALGSTAYASSHREAPLISHDPQADNTDLYAFRCPDDPNMITIIANYIPFESPEGGPNYFSFGTNVRYEIHIKNDASTTKDDITYRFTFSRVNEDTTTFFNIRLGKQNLKTTYMCEKSTDGGASWTTIATNGVVPANNIGPRSIVNPVVGLGLASYNAYMTSAVKTIAGGEQMFCGPIDDPFFVDLAGAFDLGNFRPGGLSTVNTPKDGLARFNCHTIAMKIPISMLQKSGLSVSSATDILDSRFVIGVWASASRPQIKTLSAGSEAYSGSTWVQVSRIGMPLTNEVIIPVGMKDKWNSGNPKDDIQYAAYFSNPELALYMDDSKFGTAVPSLNALRIQTHALGSFDFRNTRAGLWSLKGTAAVAGTALDNAAFGNILLPDSTSPRAVDILPIFFTGVPNIAPYQLATGKYLGNPLAKGKPFINNFLPTLGDMLRLNMAVPVTPRTDPNFSSLGIVQAAVYGLTLSKYADTMLEFIPNMDGFPNGRRLEDDVTTIELQAVSGIALAAIGLWYDDYSGSGSPVTANLVNILSFNAGITKNDTTFQASFPYVQQPWRGYDYSLQARF